MYLHIIKYRLRMVSTFSHSLKNHLKEFRSLVSDFSKDDISSDRIEGVAEVNLDDDLVFTVFMKKKLSQSVCGYLGTSHHAHPSLVRVKEGLARFLELCHDYFANQAPQSEAN